MASTNIGTNQQPSIIAENNTHFFSCNSCSGCPKLGEARYVCLGCSCPPLYDGRQLADLCQSCMNAYLGGDA